MAFFPSNPQDHAKTMAELRAWEDEQKQKKLRDKIETRRYWITTVIAVTALIKAFLPEICAGLEGLLMLLVPQ